jgi:hypothetical protein
MKESIVESRFVAEAKKAGHWQCKFTSPGTSGVPDRILIADGEVWFVELKRPDGEPRPLQVYVQNMMRSHGAKVINLDTVEKVIQFFAYLEYQKSKL